RTIGAIRAVALFICAVVVFSWLAVDSTQAQTAQLRTVYALPAMRWMENSHPTIYATLGQANAVAIADLTAAWQNPDSGVTLLGIDNLRRCDASYKTILRNTSVNGQWRSWCVDVHSPNQVQTSTQVPPIPSGYWGCPANTPAATW